MIIYAIIILILSTLTSLVGAVIIDDWTSRVIFLVLSIAKGIAATGLIYYFLNLPS